MEYVFRISESSGEHAASKTTVGVKVGGGLGVAVGVSEAVGAGVGVSGMTSRVAARQARVEKSRAIIHKNSIRGLPAGIICEFSTG